MYLAWPDRQVDIPEHLCSEEALAYALQLKDIAFCLFHCQAPLVNVEGDYGQAPGVSRPGAHLDSELQRL